MEALRIVKDIKSENLPELKMFRGQKVEIIILPVNKSNSTDSILDLRGVLKKQIDGVKFQKDLRKEWDKRDELNL